MSQLHTEQKLVASDLSVGYQTKGQVSTTLSQLDLEINAAEFICLLGPNGTGKSTLIRTLAGMQAPLGGRINLAGKALHSIAPRERAQLVSIVFTDNTPIGMMDSYTFASLGRHPYSGWLGGLSEHDHERISWALNSVDAAALSQRQLTELSDGERQKISIARALTQEAQLMLLDEPTAFLDLPRRIELMRILRDLCHREKMGMLLSTHDLDLALRYADRLWLISPEGELIKGTPETLALNGELERAFANDNLDWDTNTGSFRTHKTPCLLVTLKGDGPVTLWTRRAFERLGYGIVNDATKAQLEVTVKSIDSAHQWQIQEGGETHQFNSIDAVISWLRLRETSSTHEA